MFHRSLNASALLSGVSAIALAVAGAASHAVAQVTQDVELDPITVVSTQPVQRARATPPRVTSVRPPPPSRTPPAAEAPPAQIPVSAAPVADPMPATETLGGVSTVRQDQINQLMPTRPADLLYGMPGVYVQDLGGFRHSDTVVITHDGCRVMTDYPRELKDLVVST